MWHISTQVNAKFLSAYITVNPRRGLSFVLYPLSGLLSGIFEYYWYPSDLSCTNSLVKLCLHTYLLSLFEESPLEVIQDGRNQDTNKVVASVKYLWVLATPLDVDLGVG